MSKCCRSACNRPWEAGEQVSASGKDGASLRYVSRTGGDVCYMNPSSSPYYEAPTPAQSNPDGCQGGIRKIHDRYYSQYARLPC